MRLSCVLQLLGDASYYFNLLVSHGDLELVFEHLNHLFGKGQEMKVSLVSRTFALCTPYFGNERCFHAIRVACEIWSAATYLELLSDVNHPARDDPDFGLDCCPSVSDVNGVLVISELFAPRVLHRINLPTRDQMQRIALFSGLVWITETLLKNPNLEEDDLIAGLLEQGIHHGLDRFAYSDYINKLGLFDAANPDRANRAMAVHQAHLKRRQEQYQNATIHSVLERLQNAIGKGVMVANLAARRAAEPGCLKRDVEKYPQIFSSIRASIRLNPSRSHNPKSCENQCITTPVVIENDEEADAIYSTFSQGADSTGLLEFGNLIGMVYWLGTEVDSYNNLLIVSTKTYVGIASRLVTD